MEAAFDVKDALIDAVRAAVADAAPNNPLYGLDVHESWPNNGIKDKRTFLALDIAGDEAPATMRAGGGTRDDTFRIETVIAVWDFGDDARVIRAEASGVSNAIKALIRTEAAPRAVGCFGVPGVRNPEINGYRIVEYVLDKGRRECDIHLTVQFTARVTQDL